MRRGQFTILMLICVLIFGSMQVFAEPTGPQSSTNVSERFSSDAWPPAAIDAVAGNITSLTFHTWSLTRTWQGYYGNVTGTIVLADASNNTLYDWNDANPNGRVYASRDIAVDWTTIRCANISQLDNDEAQFSGTNETDRNGKYPVDRPNATFVNSTNYNTQGRDSMYANYTQFFVGPVQINGTDQAGECFSTVMHNSTGYVQGDQNAGNDPTRFRQVLLSDGGGDLVYTAILENSFTGFDNGPHDFEMIVAEDGHGTDTAVTTYYFYVELE